MPAEHHRTPAGLLTSIESHSQQAAQELLRGGDIRIPGLSGGDQHHGNLTQATKPREDSFDMSCKSDNGPFFQDVLNSAYHIYLYGSSGAQIKQWQIQSKLWRLVLQSVRKLPADDL